MDCPQYVAALANDVHLAFAERRPQHAELGTIILLHGFPQTSYQYRKVISPLSSAGYAVSTVP